MATYFNNAKILTAVNTMLKQGRLMDYNGADNGYKTTTALFECGIYACPECGYLQPIERSYCKLCDAEKLVIMAQETEPTVMVKAKPLKRVAGKTKLIKKYTYY